jgi:hypothetical protein
MESARSAAKKPIGGWLYLWAFWLYIGPVFAAIRSLASLRPLLDGSFQSAASVEGLQAAMIVEFVVVTGILVLMIYCGRLFSRRDRRTPTYVVLLMVLGLAGSLATTAALWFVGADFEGEQRREVNGAIAQSLGAILPMALLYPPFTLYWMRGKRVRETFSQ